MKRIFTSLLLVTAMIIQLPAMAGDKENAANIEGVTSEIGIQAYIYAYPMVLMELTRRVSTNVEAPVGVKAPMNQFAHLRVFPDHTFREVVRPNADTLYSFLWFDVSVEPQILTMGDTSGRYHMLPVLDMWTDVVAAPGSRTTGTQGGTYAIVGPNWEGELPAEVDTIRTPTNVGWLIGRTQTNGKDDYDNVHLIQDSYKITPLSQWGKSYKAPGKSPVNSDWDMDTPPLAQLARMDADQFFTLFAELLKNNPPHEVDWNMVKLMGQIGIVPGEDFDFSALSGQQQKELGAAVATAQQLIINKQHQMSPLVDGWLFERDNIGNYGTSYLRRAFVALIGLGINVPEDAVYPFTDTDIEGQAYDGSQRYVMHFTKDELPPVRGFWSLSIYDHEGYMIDNPISRNAIGDRDDLQFNEDGSLDIYIQRTTPGAEKESNWLPAPEGTFDLTLRTYWPTPEAITGEWTPPPVLKVQ